MITNKTKNTTLAREIDVADTIGKKAKGLMFKDSLQDGHALLMKFPREGNHKIWMFGMRFPLDLILLDSGKRVIATCESIRPLSINPKTWKTYGSDRTARYVIETNPGTVKETKTEPGDVLEF